MERTGLALLQTLWSQEPPRTEITKWRDGKQACLSLTFDDSSIDQFGIGIPPLNERGLLETAQRPEEIGEFNAQQRGRSRR